MAYLCDGKRYTTLEAATEAARRIYARSGIFAGIEEARPAIHEKPARLATLKTGAAFTFERGGAVYIRVRGGYRPGCGGQLYPFHAVNPLQAVYRYDEGRAI
jgi:hypothetical protein